MEIDKIIKREVISLVISIILIMLVFIGVSFASFFSVAEGESNVISFGDIDLKFCNDISCNENYANYGQTIGLTNTGGVSAPLSIYPYESDEEALATTPYIFNIANTGSLKLYIDVFLEEDKDFIPSENYSSYTQTTELYANNIKVGIGECTEGIPDINTVQISSYGSLIDYKVITAEELNVHENKTYCLWTWLDENTPNSVQSTYFVANLTVSGEYKPYVATLRNTILTDNRAYADNVSSTYVTGNGIDFSKTSDNCYLNESGTTICPSGKKNTNGKGLYYTVNTVKTEKGKRVYYFRGEVNNNYVIFDEFCWRIVRTTEDGGVKLIYAGIPVSDTCSSSGAKIALSQYATKETSATEHLIGYMYSVNIPYTNTVSSSIKTVIDSWYSGRKSELPLCWSNGNFTECDFSSINNPLSNYSSYLEDSVYCNDRSIYNGTDIGTDLTVYAGKHRMKTEKSPMFRCPVKNDKFTVASDGNNALNNPVGLLTADEINYAGAAYNVEFSNFYLKFNDNMWTMTPGEYNSSDNSSPYMMILDQNGRITDNSFESKYAVKPVITLNGTAIVSSGSGLSLSPYIIETTTE